LTKESYVLKLKSSKESRLPMVFVYTQGRFRNLSTITEMERKENGSERLFVGDEIVDGNHREFLSTIETIVPVQGDWECLTKAGDKDGNTMILAVPVLAWGQTVYGALVPITATEPGGVDGPYALRRSGNDAVYSAEDLAPYKDEDEWLNGREIE